jgi:putative DNA primase/helicase
MAVWVSHAWAHDAADISPILAFVSPEKRCGKTTALSIIGALVPKPMHNVNITTSVLFRVIGIHAPTVLIDEADTYLGDNDELRGILNGGHNRLSAYVWRSVGDDHEPRQFKVWAPKCIAMIGKLPDTLEDRALVVPLRRKQSGEVVERFRADRLNEFLPLRRMAARWAADNILRLAGMDPMVPGELNDRAQDNARAICAIADLAGGAWPQLVRASLVGIAAQPDDEPQSAGVLLLRDMAEVFETKRGERLGSSDLIAALCGLEESPWNEWRGGKPISTRGIAKMLKPFGVSPAQDRFGSFYRFPDFIDAFGRYLSKPLQNTATSATSATPLPSATEKRNEINSCGTCGDGGTCAEGGRENCHKPPSATTYEGEI